MTIAEDFAPGVQENSEDSEFPTAFGITFTPMVTFVLCVVLGIGAAGYLLWKMVLPAYNEYQDLVTTKETTQTQLDQTKDNNAQQKIINLQNQIEQQKSRQPQVLALLSSEKTVDTLLIDFNKIFQQENVVLKTYSPSGLTPQIVSDGSYGNLVNGKLKIRTVSIAFEATIPQTKSIIQKFERFQSLVVIKNFNAKIGEMPTFTFDQGQIKAQGDIVLNVSFVADVLYPLSSAELEEIRAKREAAQKAQEENATP